MSRVDNFINLPPKKNIFKVCKCGKEIYSKSMYYEHLKKCTIAESKTSSGNSIISEDDNLHPKKNVFKICKCEKEIYSKSGYYEHLKKCPIAERRTPSGNSIRLEDNNLPPKKKFFKICKCEKEFNTRSWYYEHLKKCHTAETRTPSGNSIGLEDNNLPLKKKFCKICKCEKEFNTRSWYYAHLKKCPIADSKTPSGNSICLEKDNFVNLSQKKTFLKICKCKKEFNARRSYYKHLKSCPIAKRKTPSANFICLEENCSFRTRISGDFLQHLKDIHHKNPVEDVKTFQNYSDFKTWLQNFEKEERSSFLRSSIISSETKKIEYYYCNRSGKYFSKSTGKRCLKKGSRKMGFNCPASIKAIVESESSLVTVNIKSLHYGHNLDLCHINLPKNERIEIANQLLQGIKPKEVLKNICDISSTKLERKHLCTKQDLKNIIKSYRINNGKKHVEDHLSVDIYVEEVITACRSVNDVEVKDELLLKISQIQELIETCNNPDLLLASEQHLNNALIVLNT